MLNTTIAQQLKILLETKHLYQSVSIDPLPHAERLKDGIEEGEKKIFASELALFVRSAQLTASPQPIFTQEGSTQSPVLTLLIGNVKTFCDKCSARETFIPIWHVELSNSIRQQSTVYHHIAPPPDDFQLFVLTYQCQACKSAPVAFLVRRTGWRLYLDGRSPIEHIEVPAFIPQHERKWFRDAIIAFNTGKIPAALYYLRTFIEQFARRRTGLKGRATGEELMDAYGDTLPSPPRDQMPSLRHWYDKLSETVHEPDDDEKLSPLFEEARAEIERHFDFRRIYKIPES